MPRCRLCQVADRHLEDGPPSFIDAPLLETENFVVVLGLGHLVEGYTLLVSRQHYPNFASLPRPIKDEAATLSARIRSALTTAYTHPFEYEHGAGVEDHKRGGCIVHAHLHFFPTAVDCLTPLRAKVTLRQVPSGVYARDNVSGDTAYIHYRSQTDQVFFAEVDVLPSQLIRQLLAWISTDPNSPKFQGHRRPGLTSSVEAAVRSTRGP